MEQFLRGLEPGSVGLDVGCGNGKYLAVNREVFIVASDRYVSFPCRISRLVLEYWISISVLFLSFYLPYFVYGYSHVIPVPKKSLLYAGIYLPLYSKADHSMSDPRIWPKLHKSISHIQPS